ASKARDLLERGGGVVDLDVEGDVPRTPFGCRADAPGDTVLDARVDHVVGAVHHVLHLPSERPAVEALECAGVVADYLEVHDWVGHLDPPGSSCWAVRQAFPRSVPRSPCTFLRRRGWGCRASRRCAPNPGCRCRRRSRRTAAGHFRT